MAKGVKEVPPNKPRLLLLDIETSPSLGWFFDFKKEYNIIEVEREWGILSYAYKWFDEKTVGKGGYYCKALPDFPLYKTDPHDDYQLVESLVKLCDEAHVIIAHNGNHFDIRRINARMMFHRLPPPAPYKTFDTLKMHRRIADVNSHRLDALARLYNIGAKLPNTGTHLWLGCVRGDKKAWAIMKKYNIHDVYLLDRLYPIIRPHAPSHPVLSLITNRMMSCPRCGSTRIWKAGPAMKEKRLYQTYRCMNPDCGHRPFGELIKLEGSVKLV